MSRSSISFVIKSTFEVDGARAPSDARRRGSGFRPVASDDQGFWSSSSSASPNSLVFIFNQLDDYAFKGSLGVASAPLTFKDDGGGLHE